MGYGFFRCHRPDIQKYDALGCLVLGRRCRLHPFFLSARAGTHMYVRTWSAFPGLSALLGRWGLHQLRLPSRARHTGFAWACACNPRMYMYNIHKSTCVRGVYIRRHRERMRGPAVVGTGNMASLGSCSVQGRCFSWTLSFSPFRWGRRYSDVEIALLCSQGRHFRAPAPVVDTCGLFSPLESVGSCAYTGRMQVGYQ